MRKNLQYTVLFLQTFVQKQQKQIVISAIISFFLTLLFIQSYPLLRELKASKEQKIGIVGTYNESTLPIEIQKLISFGLTSQTPDGGVMPSLAISWKVDDKGLDWTFYLRKDVYWHNGKKFTAHDINYKLRGTEFIPVSDDILKVTLKEKYAPLPVVLSQPILKPNLMGEGMYKVIRLLRGPDQSISELTLEPQLKNLPLQSYKFYPSLSTALLAFKLGEIDVLQDISDVSELENWRNVKILPHTQYDRYVGIFFNLQNSLFKEKEVRQALSYAIPKDFKEEKALTPISPLSWAYSSNIRLYNYDGQTAAKILSKSPLSSSSSQLTISTYASLLNVAQKIADAWAKVGVNIKIKVESTIPSDYQVLLVTQAIPQDPDQYQYWQSTQEGTNLTYYNNQKIDKLLEDGRKTFQVDSRKKIYADFQRYLVDDSPVIFLYYPTVYRVERK